MSSGEIKRYDLDWNYGDPIIDEDMNGDYVKHSDYAAQASTIVALKEQLATALAGLDRINEVAIRALASQPAAPVQPLAVELMGVQEQIEESRGFWQPCSGCYDTEDGHPTAKYAHSKVFRCALGSGCSECGGIGARWDNNDYSEPCGELAAPTRLDVMSLIHSQMHRVYASAIDREDIDTKYMREIEDAIMGIYHGRYIAGYDLRKSEEALATTRPSAALSDHRIMMELSKVYTPPSEPGNSLLERVNPADLLKAVRAILAASSGAVAVPEGFAVVPVEPTDEMLAALDHPDATMRRVYRAMISAAPAIPAQGQTQ